MSSGKRSAAVVVFCVVLVTRRQAVPTQKKTSKRQHFTKATFDKWQKEHKQEYRTLTWLRCELGRDKVHVESLYCAVCRKYKKEICSLKNLSRGIPTSISNMVDHARSDVHKAAVSRLRADTAREKDESAILSTPLGRCLSSNLIFVTPYG